MSHCSNISVLIIDYGKQSNIAMLSTQKQLDKSSDGQRSQMIIEHGLSKQIESSRRHLNTIHAKLDRIEELLTSQVTRHTGRRKWKRESLYRAPTHKRMT